MVAGFASVAADIVGGMAENAVSGRGFQLPNKSISDLALDFSLGALTFGVAKGMSGTLNSWVSEDISSSVGRPTSRMSLLVGSIFDNDAHPRATYQEFSGLMRAGFRVGVGWNVGMMHALLRQYDLLPEA